MSIHLAVDIQKAIVSGHPIVALETAVLTSGLPRSRWNNSFGQRPATIDDDLQINIAAAKLMTGAVQENGAIPAWIGVLRGTLRIGLTTEEIIELASEETAGKVSIATFSQTLHRGESAGTTVAATLLACKLASPNNPIKIFATGGIGGVHQCWSTHLDVSADLTALATTPTCVVASGAKSILDLHATVESLETIGVPVLGLGTDTFPRFIESSCQDDPSVFRVDSPTEVASICNHHWKHLGLKSSVLVTIPCPSELALKPDELKAQLSQAEKAWIESGQSSTTRTPYLLNHLAISTQGRSVAANLALLCSNAGTAAKIAVALSK